MKNNYSILQAWQAGLLLRHLIMDTGYSKCTLIRKQKESCQECSEIHTCVSIINICKSSYITHNKAKSKRQKLCIFCGFCWDSVKAMMHFIFNTRSLAKLRRLTFKGLFLFDIIYRVYVTVTCVSAGMHVCVRAHEWNQKWKMKTLKGVGGLWEESPPPPPSLKKPV